MRGPVRELILVIGAVAVLSAVFSVLTGIYVNFATDGRPQLNPAHILPAILFSVLASVIPPLGDLLRSRWANRTATATDPFTAHDLATYKRLLKELRKDGGTPRFAVLEARAGALGCAYARDDLEKVTKQGTRWLNDAERAEPVIRGFLAVHEVPGAVAEKWLQAYRRLADPWPVVPARRIRLAVVVTVPVVCATAAFLGYVTYAEAQVRDSLGRSNVTILSLYVPGRYLVVNGSSGPPHARLGPSVIGKSPVPAHRWDLEPDKRDGTYFHRIRNRASQRCLVPEARHVTEGIYLTEAPCDDPGDQLWRLVDGHVLALPSPQGDLCAEPSMGATEAGTPLVLRACAADRPGQRWQITDRLPDLGSSLASSHNGVCLDATGIGSGVITWECHGRANQAFSYQRGPQGDYVIRSMDRCLTVSGQGKRRYPVREPCDGAGDRLWRLTYRSPYHEWLYWEVKHVASGLCLQLEPDGRSLSMSPCTRSNFQQWRTPDWLYPPNTPVHPAKLRPTAQRRQVIGASPGR
ncbi:ricin-type beta-trefoil lectin domain protein [Nonomuraea sp. NPDC050643]|uniref:RICIN domain-containing protein n=1 Tax=Nonomuraea sp. NPDC050643 TaxID=3155660 RepID=UPI0034065803